MNQVLWLRVLLVLAVVLSIAAGSIDALMPAAVPEAARDAFRALLATLLTMMQACALGPHAYFGLAFMVSYAGKVAWGAALALAYVVTRAPTRIDDAVAQPSTG